MTPGFPYYLKKGFRIILFVQGIFTPAESILSHFAFLAYSYLRNNSGCARIFTDRQRGSRILIVFKLFSLCFLEINLIWFEIQCMSLSLMLVFVATLVFKLLLFLRFPLEIQPLQLLPKDMETMRLKYIGNIKKISFQENKSNFSRLMSEKQINSKKFKF